MDVQSKTTWSSHSCTPWWAPGCRSPQGPPPRSRQSSDSSEAPPPPPGSGPRHRSLSLSARTESRAVWPRPVTHHLSYTPDTTDTTTPDNPDTKTTDNPETTTPDNPDNLDTTNALDNPYSRHCNFISQTLQARQIQIRWSFALRGWKNLSLSVSKRTSGVSAWGPVRTEVLQVVSWRSLHTRAGGGVGGGGAP